MLQLIGINQTKQVIHLFWWPNYFSISYLRCPKLPLSIRKICPQTQGCWQRVATLVGRSLFLCHGDFTAHPHFTVCAQWSPKPQTGVDPGLITADPLLWFRDRSFKHGWKDSTSLLILTNENKNDESTNQEIWKQMNLWVNLKKFWANIMITIIMITRSEVDIAGDVLGVPTNAWEMGKVCGGKSHRPDFATTQLHHREISTTQSHHIDIPTGTNSDLLTDCQCHFGSLDCTWDPEKMEESAVFAIFAVVNFHLKI